MNDILIVLFVEGDTDKEFYDHLLKYYKSISTNNLKIVKIYNLKGIGRFESKVHTKLKFEILPKVNKENIRVFCAYDTDVFDLAKKPPVDWKKVKQNVNQLGIKFFYEIKAKQMIEDWFLLDLEGVCKYLKTKAVKTLKGKDGNEKMKDLFRKSGKLYLKGTPASKFIPSLDLKLIDNKLGDQFKQFKIELGCKIPLEKSNKKSK